VLKEHDVPLLVMAYPEGWSYELWSETDQVPSTEVMFYTHERWSSLESFASPAVLVNIGPLEGLFDGIVGQATTALEMAENLVALIEQWAQDAQTEVGFSPVEEMRAGRIATFDFWQEQQSDTLVEGISCLHLGTWGAIILGTGNLEVWEVFSPTYDLMVSGMTLFEPGQLILSPRPYVDIAGGYSIRYPSG
jgi:hypothetical protein